MSKQPTIVWFRFDLRTSDHAPLVSAASNGPVIPLFIWSPDEEAPWAPGSAHRWWLHHSLEALSERLVEAGSQLILRQGDTLEELQSVIEATNAGAVYWHERYVPALQERDAHIAEKLDEAGIETKRFAGRILHEIDGVTTTSGTSYKVFTPFWKKIWANMTVDPPLDAPDLEAPEAWPESERVTTLGLLPTYDWAGGLRETWIPGESGGHQQLGRFIEESLTDYEEGRDVPSRNDTSRLSPYLHHGELSPRQIWHAVKEAGSSASDEEAAQAYLREIGWREFSYSLLHHFPTTTEKPLYDKFEAFPWNDDHDALARWQRGQTGYPIVDAGMRQLWHTGWMHNRVRMIVASFLTKDLLIHWHQGATWFWDTLVDGDLANNTMGWQWSAGSGADAQPFFRIFNPVSQGKRFDPDGTYVRQWIPELKDMPRKYIHMPWEAPEEALREAGVTLGDTYPHPIVDHSEARDKAMEAYNQIR